MVLWHWRDDESWSSNGCCLKGCDLQAHVFTGGRFKQKKTIRNHETILYQEQRLAGILSQSGRLRHHPCPVQSTIVTTTTTNGTISSFDPQSFVVHTEAAGGPVTYGYNNTIRYVDEAGNIVTRESITPNVPVTVHYVREGDRMMADSVVVHKITTTTTEPGREPTHKEKKEMREAKEHPERSARRAEEQGKPFPPIDPSQPKTTSSTTTTTTTSDGTIRSFAPDQFVVQSSAGDQPVTYRYSKTTQYVDEGGAPVAVEVVKSGVPVTVIYVREADGNIAQRVVVHTRAAR